MIERDFIELEQKFETFVRDTESRLAEMESIVEDLKKHINALIGSSRKSNFTNEKIKGTLGQIMPTLSDLSSGYQNPKQL